MLPQPPSPGTPGHAHPPYDVESLRFHSVDAYCDAQLYMPTGVSRPPVLLMAHGLGALRAFGLAAFAERFATAGMAVLVFDYRGFGASEGQPRQLVDASRHVADYLAAIDFVRTLPQVDSERVGLWGTSYSGGHVLVAAAQRKQVRAVVSQVPFVDGIASAALFPLSLQLPALAAGVRDSLAARLGRPPLYVPIVKEAGLRVLAGDDCVAGYNALVPKDSGFSGEIPARIFVTLPRYRPIRYASRISAPVLMIGAEHDSLIPISAVRRTAARIPNCELQVLPLGHFGPYVGAPFERVVGMELDFLGRTLLRPA
ncbi:MAG TPA: alpha/beta fold hydrolase [Polyangiales bacterium]